MSKRQGLGHRNREICETKVASTTSNDFIRGNQVSCGNTQLQQNPSFRAGSVLNFEKLFNNIGTRGDCSQHALFDRSGWHLTSLNSIFSQRPR